jgi:arabinogalactan oligomer / maltooligosaccharide transport system substrate-binding protein
VSNPGGRSRPRSAPRPSAWKRYRRLSEHLDQPASQAQSSDKSLSDRKNIRVSFFLTTVIGTILFGLWRSRSQNEADQQRYRRPSEHLDQSGSQRLSSDKSLSDRKNIRVSIYLTAATIIGAIVVAWWQLSSQNAIDQKRAVDQQQETLMQTYINNMRDMLLNQHLATSIPGGEVPQAATVQTVSTLRSLDARHNTIVLQFLQDAHLIGTPDAVINLDGADLSGADLRGVNLAGVTVDGANLTNARLSGATLTGASLSDAILAGADLTGARLGGAILTSADLNGAYLRNAILSGADLIDAKNMTQRQLDEVNSCRDAPLPAGVTCHRVPIITLTYWYTEAGKEQNVITHTLIPQFERHYPGIHIKLVLMNFFDTRAAFTARAQDGNAPDVLRSDLTWTELFASEGYLLNLDSYVYQDQSELYLSDYLKLNPPLGPDLSPAGKNFSPLTYDKYDGHLYGLPEVTDVQALLYNKKELADAGITGLPQNMNMTQFKAYILRVAQKNKEEYGFETDGTFAKALPFLYACGGGILDQHNNQILLNDKGAVSGLDFLVHMQNEDNVKLVNVNLTNGEPISPVVSDFMNGKTAMIFDGSNDVPEILTGSSFSHDHGNLGIVGIPMGPAGQAVSPLGGQSYVISSGTAYPAEAYKFIEFMSSEPSQVQIAEANGTLPTRWSATKIVDSSNSFIKQFHNIWETGAVAPPAIPNAAYLFDVAGPSIRAALTGMQTASQALNTIANSWDRLGAGHEIPQSALTPGASQTACS